MTTTMVITTKRLQWIVPLLLALVMSIPALANDPVVRILFYTGNVTVQSGGASSRAQLGQALTSKDEVVIGSGASLQLSINGKVVKYNSPLKLRVADAIKRAGKGENMVVANTVRTLAAASGTGRSSRTSVAGATRADDSSHLLEDTRQHVSTQATSTLNTEIANRTGIDDPGAILNRAKELVTGEDLVVLEPRSTAVPNGPVIFRWLRSPGTAGYVISVKNYVGDEVFRTKVQDTMFVWTGGSLTPEAIYNWTLEDEGNSLRNASASFHQLDAATDNDVKKGEKELRKEVGEKNPALPIVLAAFYSEKGLFGEAARYYTLAALLSPEHYDELMERASDEYRYSMYMSEPEVNAIYRR
jgi:hypothetical protein